MWLLMHAGIKLINVIKMGILVCLTDLSACIICIRARTLDGFLGPNSIKRCFFSSIQHPIVDIRWSYDNLISTTGFPIMVKHHLCIELGPWGTWSAKHLTHILAMMRVENSAWFFTTLLLVRNVRIYLVAFLIICSGHIGYIWYLW